MFESSASRRFESSPSDMQPTANESVEGTNNVDIGDKQASPADSDAYTPNSTANDNVVHGHTVYHTPNNISLPNIVSQEFHPFDAETLIIHPIMAEESSDEKFYKELGEHLIESLLTFHAWAAARPRHEHKVVCELISSKMAKIEESEQNEGRYHTSLCTKDDLRLPSGQSSHHLSSKTDDEEHKHPLVSACPHSPLRPAFLCSRSLGMPMSPFPSFLPLPSLSQLSGSPLTL